MMRGRSPVHRPAPRAIEPRIGEVYQNRNPRPLSREEQERIDRMAVLLRAIVSLEADEACGIAAAVLTHVASAQPDMARRVLLEPAVLEGAVGVSVWDLLKRAIKEG